MPRVVYDDRHVLDPLIFAPPEVVESCCLRRATARLDFLVLANFAAPMKQSSKKKWLNKWSRKSHRWGAILILLPAGIVIGSGIFLQLKKDFAWVQPPSQKGAQSNPRISFEEILSAARTAPKAGIESWDDVDRLDVRPSKGIVKVRGKSAWEVQVDTTTGDVLQVAYRRSDIIEQIHDGTWFSDPVKLWIFLPSGCILFILWMTGIYLWWLPISAKRSNRRNRKDRSLTAEATLAKIRKGG
ncbi:MAG: PepSY domain-containing protein [Pirellulales bacterium]|nr:PepSY domain-containing protein [Pirellulales bacterium]